MGNFPFLKTAALRVPSTLLYVKQQEREIKQYKQLCGLQEPCDPSEVSNAENLKTISMKSMWLQTDSLQNEKII